MQTREVETRPDEPDLILIGRIRSAQSLCFAAVGLISIAVLAAWSVPHAGEYLPQDLFLTKASTSFLMLLSVVGLWLSQPQRTNAQGLACRFFGSLIFLFGAVSLRGRLTGRTFEVETLLPHAGAPEVPVLMAAPTALFLLLMGLSLVFEGGLVGKRSHARDVLGIAMVMLVLSILAAHLFGRDYALLGESALCRTAPLTLLCLSCLVFITVARRTEVGFFSVITGVGIGSQLARMTLPLSILLPFSVVSGAALCTAMGWLSAPSSAALTAAVTSIAFLLFGMVVASKVNRLEGALRLMSLTDELTHLHNRRSLYLLGEHALLERRRSPKPVTILYFDLDGLKHVNDTQGHAAGSQLLLGFANLLRKNFRAGDVVARVGGDEFAVLTGNEQNKSGVALLRLALATEVLNDSKAMPSRISYSVGEATREPISTESFAELMARADESMYENKQSKKTLAVA